MKQDIDNLDRLIEKEQSELQMNGNDSQPQSSQQPQNPCNIQSLKNARNRIRQFKQNLCQIYEKVKINGELSNNLIQEVKGLLKNFQNEINLLSPSDEEMIDNLQKMIIDIERSKKDTSKQKNSSSHQPNGSTGVPNTTALNNNNSVNTSNSNNANNANAASTIANKKFTKGAFSQIGSNYAQTVKQLNNQSACNQNPPVQSTHFNLKKRANVNKYQQMRDAPNS